MASASVAGIKYCLALLRPCFLAKSSWRARLALDAVRAMPPGVCSASHVQMIKGCLEQAYHCNFLVSATLLAFIYDHQEKLLHKSSHGGPLHSEVLGNSAACGQYYLAFVEHCPSFPWVDVKFGLQITAFVSFLVSYYSSYSPTYTSWWLQPQKKIQRGLGCTGQGGLSIVP